MSAHWGVPDPAMAEGNEAEKRLAFADTYRMLRNRISIFVSLPMPALEKMALQQRLHEIGRTDGPGRTHDRLKSARPRSGSTLPSADPRCFATVHRHRHRHRLERHREPRRPGGPELADRRHAGLGGLEGQAGVRLQARPGHRLLRHREPAVLQGEHADVLRRRQGEPGPAASLRTHGPRAAGVPRRKRRRPSRPPSWSGRKQTGRVRLAAEPGAYLHWAMV